VKNTKEEKALITDLVRGYTRYIQGAKWDGEPKTAQELIKKARDYEDFKIYCLDNNIKELERLDKDRHDKITGLIGFCVALLTVFTIFWVAFGGRLDRMLNDGYDPQGYSAEPVGIMTGVGRGQALHQIGGAELIVDHETGEAFLKIPVDISGEK